MFTFCLFKWTTVRINFIKFVFLIGTTTLDVSWWRISTGDPLCWLQSGPVLLCDWCARDRLDGGSVGCRLNFLIWKYNLCLAFSQSECVRTTSNPMKRWVLGIWSDPHWVLFVEDCQRRVWAGLEQVQLNMVLTLWTCWFTSCLYLNSSPFWIRASICELQEFQSWFYWGTVISVGGETHPWRRPEGGGGHFTQLQRSVGTDSWSLPGFWKTFWGFRVERLLHKIQRSRWFGLMMLVLTFRQAKHRLSHQQQQQQQQHRDILPHVFFFLNIVYDIRPQYNNFSLKLNMNKA